MRAKYKKKKKKKDGMVTPLFLCKRETLKIKKLRNYRELMCS